MRVTLLTTSEEDWQIMTETKFSAMRRFVGNHPRDAETKLGRIVNISSIGGIYLIRNLPSHTH